MNEEKFTGKADAYDKYRPTYPAELIDWLYEKTRAETVADIGAGTGIFTKCLSEKPWIITAVEPNGDMLEKLRGNVSGIEIINAPAENTGIAPASVDLVTAAQAFHWFDREKFKAECMRILVPDGRLALVWYNHGKNGFTDRRDEVFLKYCGTHRSAAYRENAVSRESLLESGYFSEVEYFRADYGMNMTEEQFVGYSVSHSYSLKKGDGGYEKFVFALREVFAEFQRGNAVELPLAAECFLGKF
ncbi:MAG: class I SAM-dependent methyltransferase [Ruminococcus sp.]|nr:class I SAM-dependent methyltransferase [Ruminococcus sp.]MCM1479401.1 class I SAM-dependent methyltransferase [Muribaculaceae bacterium]